MKFLMVMKHNSANRKINGMVFPSSGRLKNMLILIAGQGEEGQVAFTPYANNDDNLPTVDTDIVVGKVPNKGEKGFKIDFMNVGGSNPNSSTDYSNLYKKFIKDAGHVSLREVWYMVTKKISGELMVIVQGDFIPDKGSYYHQSYQTTMSSTANYSKAYRTPVRLRNAMLEVNIIFQDTADVGGFLNLRSIKNRDFQSGDLGSDVSGSGLATVSLENLKLFDSTLIARIPLAKQANGANVLGTITKTIPLGDLSRLEGFYFDYDDIVTNALTIFEANFDVKGIVGETQTPHLRILESPEYMEVI